MVEIYQTAKFKRNFRMYKLKLFVSVKFNLVNIEQLERQQQTKTVRDWYKIELIAKVSKYSLTELSDDLIFTYYCRWKMIWVSPGFYSLEGLLSKMWNRVIALLNLSLDSVTASASKDFELVLLKAIKVKDSQWTQWKYHHRNRIDSIEH